MRLTQGCFESLPKLTILITDNTVHELGAKVDIEQGARATVLHSASRLKCVWMVWIVQEYKLDFYKVRENVIC